MNDNNALILEMLKRLDSGLVTLNTEFHNHAVEEAGRLTRLELDFKQRQRKKHVRNTFIASAMLAVGSYLLPFAKQVSVDFIKQPKATINNAEVDKNGGV